MKKLEELGISPTPWQMKFVMGNRVFDGEGIEICDSDCVYSKSNARIIAAAPKMYEALHGLLEIVCDYCKSRYNGTDGKCFECPRVSKARSALAEAAGQLAEAADLQERKEKREKKYEFSVYPPEVNGAFQYRTSAELKAAMRELAGLGAGIIVRREVGEWEEVK